MEKGWISFAMVYFFGRAAKLFPKSYALVGWSELSIHFKKGFKGEYQ